ncbi:MAG TPA: hypothetical protein VFA28_17085 [Bryobacteraceae bacterium]|nr:hypothetical protein [Bryobacteraceae bacterium]
MLPRTLCLPAILLLWGFTAAAADDFRVYTDSPRLLLRPGRMRLLQRERQRESMRWQQFQALVTGGAQMPEPAFAEALFAVVSGDAEAAQRAVLAALAANDPRQTAFVLDWCGPLISPEQAKALSQNLAGALASGGADVVSVRNRALAAIALSDQNPAAAEKTLRAIVDTWWRGQIAPGLRSGAPMLSSADIFPLYELMHAIRDNLNIDLREDAPEWFKTLPARRLLSYYPAPYRAPENQYRVPAYDGAGAPDLKAAALSRVAELEMVAYDTNAVETQFLQGWLMQDEFLLRSPMGAPYEFLWANPYQPGLSYFHFPLLHYNARVGALFARSSWDDDSMWFGLVNGEIQLFDQGKVTVLNPALNAAPMRIGPALIAPAGSVLRYSVDENEPVTLFIVGLKRKSEFIVTVSDQDVRRLASDPAGTLAVELKEPVKAEIRIAPAK